MALHDQCHPYTTPGGGVKGLLTSFYSLITRSYERKPPADAEQCSYSH